MGGELPCSMQEASIAEVTEDNLTTTDYALSASILANTELLNEWEACGRPNWPHWCKAMQKEINELTHKRTWTIVNAPIDTKVFGSRWMYQLNQDAIGAICHFKAHCVVQGFTQTHGIDYNNTFSPVTKFASTHILLALAATHVWEVHQVDIKNVYLNTELTETIYMAQPLGSIKPGDEGRV